MKLNRRNVLAGLGTAAAGTAAIFGTGAWTSEESTRGLDITITDDNGGNVQLPIEPHGDTNGRVSLETNSDGVDVLRADAQNLPTNSSVGLGDFSESDLPETIDTTTLNAGAFTVTNNNAFNSDIDLTVKLASDSLESTVSLVVDDGSSAALVDSESPATFTLADGDTVDVGIWIDTQGTVEDESINITLEATEASA